MNQRDSHIVIKSLNSDEVALSGGELIWLIGLASLLLSTLLFISGGTILNSGWTENGGIKKTTFQGSCGEAFVGEQRLVPARSPNLAVFARSARPVPISGPVKDRLRPVPDRS